VSYDLVREERGQVKRKGQPSKLNYVPIMSLGFPGTVRVPLVGPFIPDSEIQEIEGQINAGAFLIKL